MDQPKSSPKAHRSTRSPLWRRNARKRGAWFHVLTDSYDDMKWLWAAYKQDSFIEFMPSGAPQEEFNDGIRYFIESFTPGVNDLFYLIEAHNDGRKSTVPVGLFVVNFHEGAAWPKAFWFSWATPRNKIEATVVFLEQLQQETPVMILADKDITKFLSHLGRYGLLSRSKVLKNFILGQSCYLHYGKKVDR